MLAIVLSLAAFLVPAPGRPVYTSLRRAGPAARLSGLSGVSRPSSNLPVASANPDRSAPDVTASGRDRAPHEPSGGAGPRSGPHAEGLPAQAPGPPMSRIRCGRVLRSRSRVAAAAANRNTFVVEEGSFRSRLRRPRDLLGAVLAIVLAALVVRWPSRPSRR